MSITTKIGQIDVKKTMEELFHQFVDNSCSNDNQSSCNLRESDCLVYIYHIRDACAFFLYRKAMYNRIILNEELNVKWTRVGLIKSVRKNPAARFTKNSDSIDCITRALKDHILQDTLPSTYEIFMKQLRLVIKSLLHQLIDDSSRDQSHSESYVSQRYGICNIDHRRRISALRLYLIATYNEIVPNRTFDVKYFISPLISNAKKQAEAILTRSAERVLRIVAACSAWFRCAMPVILPLKHEIIMKQLGLAAI